MRTKKKYTVKNNKKTPRVYKDCKDIGGFLSNLNEHGDKTCYIWREDGEEKSISYSDFVKMVKCFACGIRAQVGTGKPVAIMGETSPYWLAAFFGTIASGNIAVPMDKELDSEQVFNFLTMIDAVAFVISPTFNDTYKTLTENHPTVKNLICMSADDEYLSSVKGALSYDSILRGGNGILENQGFEADSDVERCSVMLFTSGTTGSSKCVQICTRNIIAVAMSSCASVDFCRDDVVVSVLPIHHTYELVIGMAELNYGVTIAINDSLKRVLQNFKKYQPTGLVLVPLFVNTMYKKIMSEAKKGGKEKALEIGGKIAHALSFAGIDLSESLFHDVREAFGGRLNKIICGGAALDASLIPIFENFGISIYEGYGITECAPLLAVTPYYKRVCGSVGPAVPCCEVRIDGSQTDEEGHICGEIQAKGENVMIGYYNNPEANEAVFTEDGWFRTGDWGYMDKNGYIYITGRIKSVIVLDNGKNVFPEEIEEYLEKIDEINESVVVGREDENGTKLVAVIFPNYDKYSELSEADLHSKIQKAITDLNKKLPSFKQIHKIEFRKTEFEKTTSKKIKRHLVK